jgi:hypothetical protein
MGLKVSTSQMSRHFTPALRPVAPEPKQESPKQERVGDNASDNDVQIARYLSTTAERLANLSDRPTRFKITTTIKRIDGLISSVTSIVEPIGS